MSRNISWTFLSNIVLAGVKWLMLIALAKWLAPTDVGYYALGLAVASPLTFFANMKLRTLFVSADTPHYTAYATARNIVGVIVMLILFVIAYVLYYDAWLIIILIGMSKMLDLVSDFMYALPHREQHMARISKIIIAKQGTLMVAFMITLLLTYNLIWTLFIQLVIQFIWLGIEYVVFVRQYDFDRTRNRALTWRILSLGIPLGVTQLIVSFNSFLPRYVLEYFTDAETLGYFAAIAYITVIANIVMGAISQNYLHVFKNQHDREDYKDLERTLYVDLGSIAVILSGVTFLISLFIGKFVLTILYGAAYAQYDWVLMLLSGCLFFNALNWNIDTALTSVGIVKRQLYFVVIASGISIPVTILLIYAFGIKGAAFAMITNSFFLYATKEIFFRRWLRQRREMYATKQQAQ
ncbi:lipopolysaccharide biosynthesis protein [Kurthia massiliensis]|uniref:lipopolysaccharide biosynthesis protein n=1 Tax=Kurthia massiliensis TaxID=1033739 RepID=UPI000288AA65|nr:oligosaccharide flippase family protein [Kurthia massiliensis]